LLGHRELLLPATQ